MNTEEEILADGLIEIISWVKSSTDAERPLLVKEIISYGRAYLTFMYLLLASCFTISVYVGIQSFKMGVNAAWGQWKQWAPQLSMSVIGLLLSTSLVILLADNLMRVWFSPRIYVIDKLTEIVIYK